MACALSSCFATMLKPSPKVVSFRIRAHCINPRDDERSRPRQDMVHANMNVLKEKIEQVKMKERLERCLKHGNGWNYAAGYSHNYKKANNNKDKNKELLQLAGLVGAAFGFPIVFGTLFVYFLSLLLHLNQSTMIQC